jgi:hypothetical protein
VHGGDVDQDVSSRARHAEHLGDSRVLIAFLEGIQDVERGHQIEGIARERGCRDGGANQPKASKRSADTQADRGEIETDGATEAAQHLDVCTGPATAVENACAPIPADGAFDKRRSKGTKASKPEVTSLSVSRRSEQVFHVGDCTVSSKALRFVDTTDHSLRVCNA